MKKQIEKLINQWEKEFKFQILIANDIGNIKKYRVEANIRAVRIRNCIDDLKKLNEATESEVKDCGTCRHRHGMWKDKYPCYKCAMCSLWQSETSDN